jgi:hypothetical protein
MRLFASYESALCPLPDLRWLRLRLVAGVNADGHMSPDDEPSVVRLRLALI